MALALGAAGCARSTIAATTPPRLEKTETGVRWQGAALSGNAGARTAPIERWWQAVRDTDLVASAVRIPLADTLAARRDTAQADALLADASVTRSLWAWEAVRRRAAWARAHGDLARAARLLDEADRRWWTNADEAAWRVQRAPIHLAMRDTISGEALARSVLEDHVSLAPSAGAALAILDTLAKLRGERFVLRLERRAAAAEWTSGRRSRALARNARVMRMAPDEERGEDAIVRVQWLREMRKFEASVAASDTAVRWARTASARDRSRLERARSFRAAGRSDSALAIYRWVGRNGESGALRAIAWWECAREAQDESRWDLAARAFHLADSVGSVHQGAQSTVRQAASLAGLMEWMAGREDAAMERWREGDDRRSRFWYAVGLRRKGDAEGDAILRLEFATRPGYDLYTIAARESLGISPMLVAPAIAVEDSIEPALVEAIAKLSGPLMLPDAAARIVAARDRNDRRLGRTPGRALSPSSWRAIAQAAYVSGDLAGATRAADRALAARSDHPDTPGWVPWAYPPAFEREVSAIADDVGIERALLWGLVRQESRFDPRAVSRSNALGLAQLLPGTARDMARELKEPLRSDSLLFEPSRALRYGARYLRKLMTRFSGAVPVALTAYNAGPGRVREDWREIVDRGGWALYVEMGSNADTQEYVRRILGYREAYRDLKPYAANLP